MKYYLIEQILKTVVPSMRRNGIFLFSKQLSYISIRFSQVEVHKSVDMPVDGTILPV